MSLAWGDSKDHTPHARILASEDVDGVSWMQVMAQHGDRMKEEKEENCNFGDLHFMNVMRDEGDARSSTTYVSK